MSAQRKPWRAKATAVLLLAVGVAAWLWLDGMFLAPWHGKAAQADINADGIADTLTLARRSFAAIGAGGEVLWSTPPAWKVEDFLLCDIDADGADELLLLVWRRGSYGEARPFWVERDEWTYSQHIFIYRLTGSMRPIWMSSRLRPEVRAWEPVQPGVLRILTDTGEDTRWSWVSWGLERIDGGTLVL